MTKLRTYPARPLFPARSQPRLSMTWSAWPSGAALALSFALSFAFSLAECAAAESRGELLYENSCKACHDEQVHWRDNRLATDWSSLEAQVRRWQSVGRLNWSDDDIRDVARYLNDRNYHFDPGSQTLTELRRDARASRD